MGIRSEEGIKISDFSNEFLHVVKKWKERGLVNENGEIVKLTSKGYLLLDSLMNDLFALKLL
jgi:coproporphyrinogen III oxidase-like Fe-S oxidoreductase